MKHFHLLAATTQPAKSPSHHPRQGWNLFSHNSERTAEFISRLRNRDISTAAAGNASQRGDHLAIGTPGNWLRTTTSDQTVHSTSSLSFWTRRYTTG